MSPPARPRSPPSGHPLLQPYLNPPRRHLPLTHHPPAPFGPRPDLDSLTLSQTPIDPDPPQAHPRSLPHSVPLPTPRGPATKTPGNTQTLSVPPQTTPDPGRPLTPAGREDPTLLVLSPDPTNDFYHTTVGPRCEGTPESECPTGRTLGESVVLYAPPPIPLPSVRTDTEAKLVARSPETTYFKREWNIPYVTSQSSVK